MTDSLDVICASIITIIHSCNPKFVVLSRILRYNTHYNRQNAYKQTLVQNFSLLFAFPLTIQRA